MGGAYWHTLVRRKLVHLTSPSLSLSPVVHGLFGQALLSRVSSLGKEVFSNGWSKWSALSLQRSLTNGSHDDVDLTLCFQDTVILTVICGFFWLLAIITFIFTEKNIPSLPFNWLNISKIVCQITNYWWAWSDNNYACIHVSNNISFDFIATVLQLLWYQ